MSPVWAHHYPALVRLMPETGGYFPLSSTLGNILLSPLTLQRVLCFATLGIIQHPTIVRVELWDCGTSECGKSRLINSALASFDKYISQEEFLQMAEWSHLSIFDNKQSWPITKAEHLSRD